MRGGRRRGGSTRMSLWLSVVACLILHIVLSHDHHCGHPSSLPCHVIVVHLSPSSSRVVNAKGGRGRGDVAVVGRCYKGCWALWLLDRRKRVVGHTIYSPALCVLPSSSPCAIDQAGAHCCCRGWCVCMGQGGCEWLMTVVGGGHRQC